MYELLYCVLVVDWEGDAACMLREWFDLLLRFDHF